MGQMMSVRPDVLPQEALNELKILQDSVKPFATKEAIDLIESELGGPLGQFFTEISEEPVAAASLAQVYKVDNNTVITQSIVISHILVFSSLAQVYKVGNNTVITQQSIVIPLTFVFSSSIPIDMTHQLLYT